MGPGPPTRLPTLQAPTLPPAPAAQALDEVVGGYSDALAAAGGVPATFTSTFRVFDWGVSLNDSTREVGCGAAGVRAAHVAPGVLTALAKPPCLLGTLALPHPPQTDFLQADSELRCARQGALQSGGCNCAGLHSRAPHHRCWRPPLLFLLTPCLVRPPRPPLQRSAGHARAVRADGTVVGGGRAGHRAAALLSGGGPGVGGRRRQAGGGRRAV